jgi:hypothetical protein
VEADRKAREVEQIHEQEEHQQLQKNDQAREKE